MEADIPNKGKAAAREDDGKCDKVEDPWSRFEVDTMRTVEDERVVLLLGKTRAGKSTIFHVLMDWKYEGRPDSLHSETVDPCVNSFFVGNTLIKVVDTPGLSETVAQGGRTARTQDEIVSTISSCLQRQLVRVNTVCLVLGSPMTGRLVDDDKEAVTTFARLFGEASTRSEGAKMPKIVFVLTRAEEATKQKCDGMRDQLTKLLPGRKYEVAFMGCVRPRARSTRGQLALNYANVERYRRNLLRIILEDSKEAVHFHSLRFVELVENSLTNTLNSMKEGLDTVLRKVTTTMKSFQKTDSGDLSIRLGNLFKQDTMVELLRKHETHAKALENLKGYMSLDTLKGAFSDAQQQARQVKDMEHIPHDKRRRLCLPWFST